jgi:shikimate 5-dehydrogenase
MEAMTVELLKEAERDTFYFIGMTTAKSSIMKVFPKWAEYLGLGDVPIQGIDCKWHDDPEVYRQIVRFIKQDPKSLGGLVTTHKLDLLEAARDIFDELGPYAKRLDEVSSISKRDGRLWGHAKDPITSGLAMNAFVSPDHWKTGAELCLLGAGGSSLALTMYLIDNVAPDHGPGKIVVTNRSLPRLDAMKRIHAKTVSDYVLEYHHCPEPKDNDRIVSSLADGSVVVNATGLGKDAPGSPVTNDVVFPKNGYAWEFNYRGDLLFMDQANAQKKDRGLTVEDGWIYFIHGWTRVISEVFHVDIPTSGPEFDELSRIAAETRKK